MMDRVHDIVQEAVIKTTHKKKKCKKVKWLSQEVLQIAEERREPKSKRDRKSYIQLNAEFLRIARKNKPFLNEHCAKAEENIRMGRTRDLFKKNCRDAGNILRQAQ